MKEYTAKTLEDAIAQAASANKCKSEEITYVLKSEEKHFLGIGNTVTIEAYGKQDVKDFIFDYLGSYFTDLNQAVSIEIITEEEDTYKVILDAENNALIIGKNGQTLRAISNVLRSAVNNEFKSSELHKRLKVQVDVNNYKESRYRKVEAMAKRIAREVSKSHVEASLDPMPSDERRIIHQALNNYKNISTTSQGEGSNRHIVIKYVENEEEVKEEE